MIKHDNVSIVRYLFTYLHNPQYYIPEQKECIRTLRTNILVEAVSVVKAERIMMSFDVSVNVVLLVALKFPYSVLITIRVTFNT